MNRSDSSAGRRRFLSTTLALGAGCVLGAGCGDRSDSPAVPALDADSALVRLRAAMDGNLILPGDAGYDGARRVASFNPRSDLRPAVIARCASADDVRRALDYARSSGLPLAVRGGGHDVMGRSVCAGGVLIDLAPLHAVAIDPARRVATAQAGVRAGALSDAAAGQGLSAVLGCNPGVGIAGLTLGGGLGWLLGRHGAACDNLLAADVVTADGRLLRASADQHADLFWALRGGGGNFGIVTSFEYALHPLDAVTGGYLVYRGAQARDFLRAYRDVMAAAPDELVVEVVILASAEPPTHEAVAVAVVCHCGEPDDAERALAPLRAVVPVHDGVRRVTYARLLDPPPAIARIFGLPVQDGAAVATPEPATAPSDDVAERRGYNHWQGASLSDWSDAAIDAFIACAATAPRGWSMGLGHHMHGQLCRVAAADTPLLRSQGRTSYYFNAGWGDADDASVAMGWVDESLAAMARHSDAATYVNYLSSDEQRAVAAAYGENYPRLSEIKRRYDPDNVFRLNRNIAPA